MKRETLWAFWHFSLLQNILKNLKVGPFEGEKSRKISRAVQKKLKESHIAEKNYSKKFLANAKTRTAGFTVNRVLY